MSADKSECGESLGRKERCKSAPKAKASLHHKESRPDCRVSLTRIDALNILQSGAEWRRIAVPGPQTSPLRQPRV